MTDGSPSSIDEGERVVARPWSSLWLHAALLALVLCGLLAVTSPGTAWSSDEGAAILQAEVLDDTGGWLYDYPFEEFDPEGLARPFPHNDVGSKGLAPYAKHPLYPVILRGGGALGGTAGLYAAGVAGVVLAATAAALIGRRLDPSLTIPVLWVTGLGSPLWFDSQVVLAHSLAAAAVGGAVLAALRMREEDRGPSTDRGRPRWVDAALLAGASMLAVLLRSEALLLAPALVLGVTASVLVRRKLRSVDVWVGGIALVSTAVAWTLERATANAILGRPETTPVPPVDGSWLAGRLEGLTATWLDPSYVAGREADVATLVATFAVVLAAVQVRFDPRRRGLVIAALAVAVAGYTARLVLAPPDAIPGLLPAFPIGVAGVLLLTREDLRTPARVLVAGTAGALVAGVLLTQYGRGGGLEWGGRYFALALPLVVPVVVLPFARLSRDGAARPLVRPAAAAALAVTLLLIVVGTADLRANRQAAADLAAVLDDAGGVIDDVDRVDGRPVVFVPGGRLLPQILWPEFDDYRWVVTGNADIAEYGARLEGLGPDRVVMVSAAPEAHLEQLEGWRLDTEIGRVGPLRVAVLEPA